MANTPDVATCNSADMSDAIRSPFHSLRYHFGMLLGVSDFEVEQTYHRGKMWLHNRCLHGAGVAKGFDVQLDTEQGEVRVTPGLAIDALGRELHLDQAACLNVAAWFEANKDKPGMEFEEVDGEISFDAHVVVRFKACLSRQVPALSEPCENGSTGTAYSRVLETVEIFTRPGHGVQDPKPYHRLRLLFGLDDPNEEDGVVVAADQEVLDAPKNLESFRRFAALDQIDQKDPDEADEYPVLLANLTGVTLTPSGDDMVLTGGAVDVAVRNAHVATSTIQELLCGPVATPGGPFVLPASLQIDEAGQEITFNVSGALAEASVEPDAFALRTFDGTSGWTAVTISNATYDDAADQIVVAFDSALSGQLVRFVVRGGGETPLLGADLNPVNNGQDFVHSQERS